MSVATLKRQSGVTGSKARRLKTPWKRPKDWPALPPVNVGDQKLVALAAVFDHDANFASVLAAGAYTVDWGDGTAPQNVATGLTVHHQYDYASVAGSPTSEGFKTVIVTITPQAANNLTTANLTLKHTQAGLVSNYATLWLDVKVAGSLLTSLVVALGTNITNPRNLRQFEFVGTHTLGSAGASALFSGANNLESVILPRSFTTGMTNVSSMFNGCSSLRAVPSLDTSSVTNFASMFQSCGSLTTIPAFDTSHATSLTSLFQGCSNLLESPPITDSATLTTVNSMYQSCLSLKTVPLFDTSHVTSFANMFSGCQAIRTVPAYDISAATSMSGMYQNCPSLLAVPTPSAGDGHLATTVANFVNGCSSLESVGSFDWGAVTAGNMTAPFTGCPSLAKCGVTNAKLTHSYQGCRLSAAELNRIYTNLPTVVGQTITVTSNFGVSGDDPTIATAKGWTVTGS